MNEENFWRKCSSCKKTINFLQNYYRCNVSTCNRKGKELSFCSVACWESHVPIMGHRDSWAEEATAPSSQESIPARKIFSSAQVDETQRPSASVTSKEILVVVSKLKAYIKAKSGMNVSADVNDFLSNRIRSLTDEAIISARQNGRKTVMARDYRS